MTSKRFYCMLYLLIFPIAAAAQITTEDTTVQHLLSGHINAWMMHNPETIEDVFNKDTVYEDISDFSVKHVGWFSCGNRLSCEWIMTGTLIKDSPDKLSTGKSLSVRGTSVAIIKDGKFEHGTDYHHK